MKNLFVALILCIITELSFAQFSLSKILVPDTVFSSNWKTDLINYSEWKLIKNFTVNSGTVYTTPNENIIKYDFKFFDSSVSIRPSPIDSNRYYFVKYLNKLSLFQLKLPLYTSESDITYLLFNFKICFLDSTYLLVERELEPIYLDLETKKLLFRKNVMQLNRRSFPLWALYPEKDFKILRKYILFKRTNK
jgi:hypothetical protein